MTKKVVIGFFFSVFLTVVLWQVTARLSFGRALDDIAFMASPIVAIVISVLLVRSKLMHSNRTNEDADEA
ncbi:MULTISPECIES: hypothetical protein [unclassified Mesorhizobium]|uniref:hypothetical protein n=1 Tax=unclassified Mesorhizobium TaxID=325217 RepID=UPI000FCBC12B|nr:MULTISPECIES: hypothetical protein [unclassified Mesorhizobium]RUW72385.1 hypothetical protein EOA31_15665 [Mesorhizobium sp. M4B.F.Ca.ET.049.02.1.2]RVD26210.1 hypothetical protein EN738_13290 [Mesorhizobium sp. M4B.F.Ca.ET.017.02.2.1]TGV25318.1 hypothetical protein EN786_18085 [Mesorhizobium sp. M4B.F.Ca.ET.143.01.1.1]